MFQKPFKVKSNTQLKGSERKKLRSEIQKHFPELTDEDIQHLLPPKDPITAMKVFTHNSEQLMVYSNPNIPFVFEIEKLMYPTVYLLWKFPNLLYTYTTWDPVVPKLMNGADLMLPGVVVKLPYTIKSFGKFEKGHRVAVNTSTNKAPIAVGKTALSSLDMYMSAKRGKGVQILHTIGDHLWFQTQRPVIPQLGPPEEDESNTDNKTEDSKDQKNECKDNGGDDDVCDRSEDEISGDNNEEGGSEEGEENDEEEEGKDQVIVDSMSNETCDNNIDKQLIDTFEDLSVEPVEESPQESMDNLMKYCFLKAWRTSAKKPTLPLLTSNFFRLHMIPACPVNHSLDVKKSTFKKLSTFLSVMSQEGIIKVKEQIKGVESIVEVNLAHPSIRAFELRPDDVPEEQAGADVKKTNTSPNIVELYKITAHVLPIFKNFNHKKGDSLTCATIRQHLTDYVKEHNLQDTINQRLVVLDAVLQDALEDNKGSPTGNVISKLSWEELMHKCMARMTQTYHLTATGPTTAPPPKGKLEPIDIRVSMRSGNKKVTLVNNMELFGIVCQDFARKCQHGVAASTSISAVPGKKSAQVLVQGNQVDFIGKLLLNEYKIPLRYIRGLENAPPKKGAKKKPKK